MTQQRRKRRKTTNRPSSISEEAQVEEIEEEVEEEEVEEIEEDEEEELEDEVDEESYPMGMDPSILFSSPQEKSLEIIFEGQKWVFKYKELTWGEKTACVDKAQSWDEVNGFQFSLQTYYASALTRMLTDSPIRPITETTLNKLDRRIGERLVSIVPQPVEEQIPDLKER
jgi:hypothetical protein